MFEDVCDLTHVAKSSTQRKNRGSVTINMTGLQRGVAEVGQLISTKLIKIKGALQL